MQVKGHAVCLVRSSLRRLTGGPVGCRSSATHVAADKNVRAPPVTEYILRMTKLTKTLLIISLVCFIAGLVFTTGLVNAQDAVALYTVLPTGAVFLGLFLISLMLEKETALYDADQRAPLATAKGIATSRASNSERH